MFKTFFGEYIQSRGLTAYKIAKETGISKGLMNDYKNGTKTPATENLIKIADYLNCSIDLLLGRVGADETEIQLINDFRSVTDDGKKAILKQVSYIVNDKQYQKYTDIAKDA